MPGLGHRGIGQQLADRSECGIEQRRQVGDGGGPVRVVHQRRCGSTVAKGQVPRFGRRDGKGEPYEVGPAGLQRGCLGVKRDDGRGPKPLHQRRQFGHVVHHDDITATLTVLAALSVLTGLVIRRLEPLHEGVELQLAEQCHQPLPVGFARGHRVEIERNRHVALDGDQFLRKAGVVGLAEQRLAGTLAGDVGGARQQGLKIAVLGEQLLGALGADPLHTWHVVAGITHEGEVVDHLRGRDAQALRCVGLVHPGLVHTGRAAPPRI